MEQIKRLIEKLSTGIVKSPDSFSENVTRERKEIVVFNVMSDLSILVVLRQAVTSKQADVSHLEAVNEYITEKNVKFLNDAGRVVDSCIMAKKQSDSPVVLTGLWSLNPRSSVVLYGVALRLWKKIQPDFKLTGPVKSMLDAYANANDHTTGDFRQTYTCPPSILLIDIRNEVRTIDVSTVDEDSIDPFDILATMIKDTYKEKVQKERTYTAAFNTQLTAAAVSQTQSHPLKSPYQIMTVKESQEHISKSLRLKHPRFRS